MTNIKDLSTEQLKRAIEIKEQIEALQAQLDSIESGGGSGAKRGPGRPPKGTGRGPGRPKGSRKMSAAGRRAIAAAAKARWAKYRGESAAAAAEKPAKKRRKMSAAARKKMAAFAKARWAKAKAAGKTTL
jgi:hypothetical protein